MRRQRRRKIWLVPCLVLVGFLVFVGVNMATMEASVDFKLTYEKPTIDFSGISYDAGFGQWAVALNGKVVAGNTDKLAAQPTASTAKMILALAVMEKKPFELGETGETITISEELYNIYADYLAAGGSVTAVQVGEEISEYDALVSALLPSSNNMADTLAIWAFSSLDNYRAYATEMLVRLGATNTALGPDASGFSTETTSTAEDLVKIGEAVMRQPVLSEIVSKASAAVPVVGVVENTNKLLGTLGISGIKTGYIGDASGYCLVSGYKEGEDIITVAVLGAPYRQTSFDVTAEIVEKAQAEIKTRELLAEGQEVAYYESWWSGKTPVEAASAINGVAISEVNLSYDEDAGVINVYTDETSYQTRALVDDFPKEPTFWQRFLHVFGWKAE